MDQRTFNELKNNHGKFGSFALWNEEDITDKEVIEKYTDDLKKNLIICGLSSKAAATDFENSHISEKSKGDLLLRAALNGSTLRGAWLTDLAKFPGKVTSKKVNLSKPKVKKYLIELEKEMKVLKSYRDPEESGKDFFIIAHGQEVFDILNKQYGTMAGHKVVFLPHFSSRISKKKWAIAVRDVAIQYAQW